MAQVVVALKQKERDWHLAVCENSSFNRAGWGSLREEHIDAVKSISGVCSFLLHTNIHVTCVSRRDGQKSILSADFWMNHV